TGPGVFVAACVFGLMAGSMRRAIYRRVLATQAAGRAAPPGNASPQELAASVTARLAEAAMVAGLVGGHGMMLFSVALLRTQSQLLFEAWFKIVPALAALGTVGFTLAVRPATSAIRAALAAGPSAPRARLDRGLRQALALPDVLSYLNFGLWIGCTIIGVCWI